MGLDGISANQLRITPEYNSAELNEKIRFDANKNVKTVDGLANGQKVDPDKEKEHEKQQQKNSDMFDDEDENSDIEEHTPEPIIKYDLSKSDKYMLQISDDNNSVVIVDKNSKKIVRTLDAQNLSKFVNFLADYHGSVIDRKF